MKTILLSSLFCLFNVLAISQDTLFFKSSAKSVVIVKEISPTEIQYKKFEMPDGPMYIISKNDVEKIVYKNGYTEVLKPSEPALTAKDQPVIAQYNAPPVNLEKITYEDTKRKYYSIVNLVNRHPDQNRRSILMGQVKSLRKLKRNRDGTRTMAIVFGGIATGGAAIYALIYEASGGSSDFQAFAAPPVIFGVASVAFTSASIVLHVNLNTKRKVFVDLYNQ